MPAAKRLDPTRSLRELIGWLIRLYRGEWIAERLAHKLSEALGRQVSVWMVSRWETGSEPLPAEAAVALDQVFQTRGLFTYLQVQMVREEEREQQLAVLTSDHGGATIVPASGSVGGQEVSAVPTRRAVLGWISAGTTAAIAGRVAATLDPYLGHALQARRPAAVMAPGRLDELGSLVEELKVSYSATPAQQLYANLLATRTHVGDLLEGSLTLGEHRELLVIAGWLSALLGLACFDLGRYAAARVWCDDAWERAIEAAHPEVAAWSREPLTIMWFYLDRPADAIAAAQQGLAVAQDGSVVKAKLTAAEMRALARFGSGHKREFTEAWRRAEAAVDRLPLATEGFTFRAVHKPTMPLFTVQSLLLLGEYGEAEPIARQLIDLTKSETSPAGYALYRIEHALALAGLGHADGAAALGMQVLDSRRPRRRQLAPVIARAGELDQALQRWFPGTAEARDFHERYLVARQSLQAQDAGSAAERV